MAERFAEIRCEILEMAKIVFEMWQLTHQAFMEHRLDLFTKILGHENRLNDLEKRLTLELTELGRNLKIRDDQEKIPIYMEIVEDIEIIGDYCKDILERVEIKISEKLLFSDDAVNEYNLLYFKTEEAIRILITALEKKDFSLLKKIIDEVKNIEALVEELRKHHHQRLLKGICSPLAGNMFINMLDFTVLSYYQVNKISQALIKL